jgi:hypothetical protein
VGVFRFPFIYEGPTPELVAAVLHELALGARDEIGTAEIGDSSTFSKLGMCNTKLIKACRESRNS